ncbi:DUF305 domain-containing protein [Streptomyces sp. NPDC004609]|uniref:DUF305 domain-containing protein n=1 Tax=Streptomyces sp. NPDC004609 TaxID=3364704 RepID=UPI003680A23C
MTAIKRAGITARRPWARRTALAATVAAAGLVLAACGNDDMDGMDHGSRKSSTAASAPAGDNPAPGAFNDADVMFAQMMIPHHEQALQMSELAASRAKSAEIKTLATRIAGAQEPEIQKMKSWLKAWGKPESGGGMPGMDHGNGSSDGSGMSGMMSEKDMEQLKAAKGVDFDKKFAQMMIDHHKGAITMAEDEQKKGRNATAKQLAANVVQAQQTEVDEFTAILGRL